VLLLQCQQLGLAGHRQACQGCAAGHAGCVHTGQDAGERRAGLLRVEDLLRQRGHQCGLARFTAAGFQGVVERGHAWVPLR